MTSIASGRIGHPSEFVDSALPSGSIARDEAECSVISGAYGLRGAMVQSRMTPDRWAFPFETVTSSVGGLVLLRDEAKFSPLGGGPVGSDEFVRCEITDVELLPTELVESEISGKRFRGDEAARSVQSGRVGHLSEMVQSVLPVGLIASDEAAVSALSGMVACRSLMLASAAQGSRVGLPAEFTVSGVSGERFLNDEIERSVVSGVPAGPGELSACSFTGSLVLPSELLRSNISRRLFRCDEAARSVLSGREGHVSEFVRSVVPSGWISSDEAARSAVSDEWGARAQMVASARPPHRLGFASQAVECELSRRVLLRDEVEASSVSGRNVDSELLVASEASGLRALSDEMMICEATGRRLLPRELGICGVTGRRIDRRELRTSPISGRVGLAKLMVRCEETGQLVLPDELVRCELSSRMVVASECSSCVLTGRTVVTRLARVCPSSGEFYIDDAESLVVTKQRSGFDRVLATCTWTERRQLSVRLGQCVITGLPFERELLNGAGEASPLRSLLDAEPGRGDVGSDASISVWIRSERPDFQSIDTVETRTNPSQSVTVAAVRVKSGLFGFGSTTFAVVVRRKPHLTLLCEPIAGKRGRGGWRRTGQ
jgi:hypothetical protein